MDRGERRRWNPLVAAATLSIKTIRDAAAASRAAESLQSTRSSCTAFTVLLLLQILRFISLLDHVTERTDLLSSSLCYSRRVQDTILMDLLKVKHVGRYHSSADRADPRFSCSYLVYTPPIKTIALFLQIFYVGPFVTTPLTSLCLTQTQLCTSFCGANDRALASADCCVGRPRCCRCSPNDRLMHKEGRKCEGRLTLVFSAGGKSNLRHLFCMETCSCFGLRS